MISQPANDATRVRHGTSDAIHCGKFRTLVRKSSREARFGVDFTRFAGKGSRHERCTYEPRAESPLQEAR